jgi:hypothetical protein
MRGRMRKAFGGLISEARYPASGPQKAVQLDEVALPTEKLQLAGVPLPPSGPPPLPATASQPVCSVMHCTQVVPRPAVAATHWSTQAVLLWLLQLPEEGGAQAAWHLVWFSDGPQATRARAARHDRRERRLMGGAPSTESRRCYLGLMGWVQRTKSYRVAVLLLLLAAVGTYAVVRTRRLDLRTRWIKAVEVSVVLVATKPVPPEVEQTWRRTMPRLESWFTTEWERYRKPADVPMVTLTVDGVAQVERLPEPPGDSQGSDRAFDALAFNKALDDIEARIPKHPPRDVTVFVLLHPAVGIGQVEGVAEAGGRRGLVDATLAPGEIVLETMAVAHEVLHCLGATDKYDENGHARGPEALVDPRKVPLFPQDEAEVMVGERPVSPVEGAPVHSLNEVGIGPKTAEEIRWR